MHWASCVLYNNTDDGLLMHYLTNNRKDNSFNATGSHCFWICHSGKRKKTLKMTATRSAGTVFIKEEMTRAKRICQLMLIIG